MNDLANQWLWELDGWIVVAGVLCALSSSLLGNFLVLRRMSMLGDAVSHAVLPGLAAAFLWVGDRHSIAMFIGAALVGVLTAILTQWIKGLGKVDEGASMGVVFTTLFALGLVMIVQAADTVDLDPGCVLYGAIEFTPLDTMTVLGFEIPRVVTTLGIVTLVNIAFVSMFYKELKLTSFDAALADTIGMNSSWIHYGLMTLVAVTAVASFESVGNILVVAMMIVPASAASLLTDRLPRMIGLSAVIATLSAILGHLSAIHVPRWFGYGSTSTSGMIALVLGVLFGVSLVFSPKQGWVISYVRQYRLSMSILMDDVLGYLFRHAEKQPHETVTKELLQRQLLASPRSLTFALWACRYFGTVAEQQGQYSLTDLGHQAAAAVVRSHRLWEQYLIDQAGVDSERIHGQAEQLEHFTNRHVRDELERETAFPAADPHGSPIPAEKTTNPLLKPNEATTSSSSTIDSSARPTTSKPNRDGQT